MKRIAIALLVAALSSGAADTAYAEGKTSYSKAEFYGLMGNAGSDMYRTWGTRKLEKSTFQYLEGPSEVKTEASQGAWTWLVRDWCGADGSKNQYSTNFGKGTLFTRTALIENYGDGLQYSFIAQDLGGAMADIVDKDGDFKDFRNDTAKKYKDLKFDFRRVKDGFALTASFPYAGGVEEPILQERIRYLMESSIKMICTVNEAANRGERDLTKALRKTKLTNLSRIEFLALISELAGYEATSNIAKEGSWAWGIKKGGSIWLDNTGTQMDLWVQVPIEQGLADPKKEKVMAAVLARAQKKPAKDAAEVGAQWFGKDIWVKFSYPYAGKLTGENVQDYYKDFTYDYAQDLLNDSLDIVKNIK